MGWIKYLEDNISIYNDCMYLKECIREYTPVQQQQPVKWQAVIKRINECKAKNNNKVIRHTASSSVRTKQGGLELKIPAVPEKHQYASFSLTVGGGVIMCATQRQKQTGDMHRLPYNSELHPKSLTFGVQFRSLCFKRGFCLM